ncbi:glycoside hydrolase family 16 protein [Hypholoma sublateritium FD-334 SS-4]|uniref:Glycoside hydrolase family 16 protein n=1 Tax=Hypholoma sublateritium (strain FD-334 SS-4) TaxID=945553 RepID=A0A0D2NFG4_HYPSF|nr:glycoside hydrolase family 16 protein [Hypholoma sublateritium FD-334 SS-4]
MQDGMLCLSANSSFTMKDLTFHLTALLLLLTNLSHVLAAPYWITDNIVGNDFYRAFEWENIADPTHGRVNYVDQATSKKENLTVASLDSFVMRTDFTTVLNATGPGRNSVRIRSVNTYTTHVAVFDVRHMPQGCGTWPAIWETKESDWPAGGEIDIVEGVNDQVPNAATLHTTAGCTMPQSRNETGTPTQLDCDTAVNGNAGCGVHFPTTNSYGPPFNAAGGGWFAVERTNTYINIWFWSRKDPAVPLEVKFGAALVDTSRWGLPTASFPDTSCDIPDFFQENNIIINITLCGDWAGAVFTSDGCPGACVDYVDNNPAAFQEAYFDFAAVRVYQ